MDKLKILVHSFVMSDNDDPEIFAGQPIWEWQQTEAGRWVMEHAVEQPVYQIHPDMMFYGYHCKIWAVLSEKDTTFFKLKYSDHLNRKTMG